MLQYTITDVKSVQKPSPACCRNVVTHFWHISIAF